MDLPIQGYYWLYCNTYIAFYEKREFDTTDLLLGIDQIIPLSQLDKEKIDNLQNQLNALNPV